MTPAEKPPTHPYAELWQPEMARPENLTLYPQLWQPENWRYTDDGENFYLQDPLTGELLEADSPPPTVEMEPELQAGFDFLRRNASMLRVIGLYVSHRTASDLGDDGEFERIMERVDLFGHEAVGSTAVLEDRNQQAFRRFTESLSDEQAGNLPEYLRILSQKVVTEQPDQDVSFHARLYREMIRSNTPSFTIDLRGDGTNLERQLILAYKHWEHNLSPRERGHINLAVGNMREWIAAATLGLQIRKHVGKDVLDEPLWAGVLLGDLHQDFTRKMGCLGVAMRGVVLPEDTVYPSLVDDPTVIAGSTAFYTQREAYLMENAV